MLVFSKSAMRVSTYTYMYFHTGSGKTYTIEGSIKECQGIIPRATQLIFSRILKPIYRFFVIVKFE